MRRLFTTVLTLSLVAVWLAPAVIAQDRAAMEQRLRTELAKILKKDAAQLPVDKPVTGLGADALDVIEWQMAAERTYRVNIADDKLFEPAPAGKDPTVRKDLTISSMAVVVATAKPWPAGKTK